MSIGSTIKHLRREKDITQEQLAEYLGITSRAISQWECDRTAPDISQIPALCHIFDVSSDVLLGIDIERNNEEIQKYLTKAAELGYQGNGSERTALLREANKKFPRDIRSCKALLIRWYVSTLGKASRNMTRCLILAIESLRNAPTARFDMRQSTRLEPLMDMQEKRRNVKTCRRNAAYPFFV